MSVCLDDLSAAIKSNNEQAIITNLKATLAQGTDIELANNSIIKNLLTTTINNGQIRKLAAELIAEWCKIKHNRTLCTERQIIEPLLGALKQQQHQHKDDDDDVVLSSIRALANICYENDEARKIIDKEGLLTILALLEADRKRENGSSLTLKSAGLLVNLLMSNEDLQKVALTCNILNIVEDLLGKYINSFQSNQTLFTFLLIILDGVVDYVDEQNIPITDSLCLLVIDVFKKSEIVEISVACLEILHSQSEKGKKIEAAGSAI